MLKGLVVAAFAVCVTAAGAATEPDGLTLPPGFHAKVVAEGLGPIRHMAIRDNGDIYVSTLHTSNKPSLGIFALRPGADHVVTQTEHFSDVDDGTGIRIYKGALYAASSTAVYRFPLEGNALVPAVPPQTVIHDLTKTDSHAIAFDGKGSLFVTLDGADNICAEPHTPKGEKPKGLMPCPSFAVKAGIWRFSDSRLDQKFSDGERFAIGIRDSTSLDWRAGDALYGAVHGRDGMNALFPETFTAADDDVIADEMFRIARGTDLGWPYTYYDGARKLRLVSPEYGGDGKTAPPAGKYADPVAAFYEPRRPAVVDLIFYTGKQFPGMYRGGAFLAMHGGADTTVRPNGQSGYNIVFVPFKKNQAGTPVVFADGFAGPLPSDRTLKAAVYRPMAVAVGPDGALYVADSNKGRIWRIAYGEKP